MTPNIQTSQVYIQAVTSDRQFDPRVRAWTYTMDGHDFYVLQLGNEETLVYDTHSQQWSVFGSGDSRLWEANIGANWAGGSNLNPTYDANVLVGDARIGSVYFLDSTLETDNNATDGNLRSYPFERKIEGQIYVDTYDRYRVGRVHLLGSIGDIDDSTLTSIELEYSDDRGDSYVNAGAVSVPQGEYMARVDWRSLGSFQAPGRLFRFKDRGALASIDSVELDSPDFKG